MPVYHFEAVRSNEPHEQVPNVLCTSARVGGETDVADANTAWRFVKALLLVPGVWSVRMRRGHRWLKSRRYRVGK